MLKAIYILDPGPYTWIYGPQERADIAQLVDVYAPAQTRASIKTDPSVLAEADLIFSGWGAPEFNAEALDAAPKLKAVFYGAGSIRGVATDALWDRGIIICSAWAANAVPDEKIDRWCERRLAQVEDFMDAHPSDASRLEQARSMAAPGMFRHGSEAVVLFSSFETLSRQVTALHYRDDLGLRD